MIVIDTSEDPHISIIGCLHGDELFGQYVIEKFKSTPGLRLILANEEAIAAGRRYLDEDLNRCFPGDLKGNREQRLAHELLPHIKNMDYVLDIHTTTSDITMTPIVPHVDPQIRKILNACSSTEIIQMGKRLAAHSLIGNVRHGVSLEFNEDYANASAAMNDVEVIVASLQNDTRQLPRYRQLFRTVKLIPLDTKLPNDATNFVYCPELDLYPFLLREKSYTSHHGFAAKRYAEMYI